MNRAIAAVYSISVGSKRPSNGKEYTDEDAHRLVKCIPALVTQVQRLDKLLADPFIRGYIERFGEPGAAANGQPQP